MTITTGIHPDRVGRMSECRQAKCQCGKIEDSGPHLGMFQDLSAASDNAKVVCGKCGFFQSAHRGGFRCANFEPVGELEFDRFWCGCGGTD